MKIPNFKFAALSLQGTQPVFNKPVDTGRRYAISRTIYTILLCLMIGFSLAVIAFKATTLDFIEDNLNTGFAFSTDGSGPMILAALPKKLYTAPCELAMVAAVVALSVAILHLVYIGVDWTSGTKTQSYSFRRNAMFLHFTNTIVLLFSLVSTFVTHNSSSHFRSSYLDRKADRILSNADPSDDTAIQYNIGTFDLETWSCELTAVPGIGMVAEDYGHQCRVEAAGRWIMVPFLIVGVAIAGWSIVIMMRGRWDGEGRRLKTEDAREEERGLEMGSGKGDMTGFNAL